MATAPIEEEAVVKNVLANLRVYLRKFLCVDDSFILALKSEQLLAEDSAGKLESLISKGGGHAVDGLLDYMSSYYDEEMLEKFCSFLKESSKSAKPLLRKIAQKIRDEMKKLHPTPAHQAETVRDVESQSTAIDLSSFPPTTQGESTSAVSTGDERSQKIKEIVKIYRNNEEVHLPRVPDLEDAFDDIMVNLGSNLLSADPKTIDRLHTKFRLKYRRYIHGVRSAPLPDVVNTPRGLLDFVVEKSNAYEILLVQCAVDELKCEDLKDALKTYEEELAMCLRTKLLSFKRVVLPSHKDHTHMAIVLRNNPEL